MNKIYRVLWNEALGCYLAVPETAKSGSAGASATSVGGTVWANVAEAAWAALKPLVASLMMAGLAHAGGPAAGQLPVGGQVVAGSASISQNGAVMDILQATDRAAVNWQSFDVGSGARVNFHQPQASSVILNRVLGSAPSQIFGQINANGQVFLTNSSGVYFAPGSSVDVGALTATTHNIRDADLMAGNYQFDRNGATGSVVNEGTLRAKYGGYIALLAPEVRNQGLVVATKGTVALAAGERYQLQLDGDSRLSNIVVSPATIAAMVENGNAVEAPGGLIILSAQAASRLQAGVVKNTGVLSATGLVRDGGVVRLVASDHIENTGSISADAAPNSAGQGGRIEVIADLSNLSSSTQVDGTLSAQGGSLGGDGGFIETSAARLSIVDSAKVSTLAPKGLAGNWLLDPNDFEVSSTGNISGSSLSTLLGSSNVTLQAGTGTDSSSAKFGNITSGTKGNINIYDDVSWSANTLTLNAGYNINVGSSSNTGSLTVTGSGALALNPSSTLVSGYTTGGAVLMGMASGPAGGLSTGYLSGASFTTGSANGFNGQINAYTSGAIRISGGVYTLINSESGLTAINSGLNGNYVLGSNFSLSTAYNQAVVTNLTGVINGFGHKVSNLSINNSTASANSGLVSTSSGSISNIGVAGSITTTSANTSARTGGLLGIASGGTYNNNYSTVTINAVNSGQMGVGGLVGFAQGGAVINNVYATGNITASSTVGGLIGTSNTFTLSNAYATGNVTANATAGQYQPVGGLVGGAYNANLSYVYATGSVTANSTANNSIGGLIGEYSGSQTYSIAYAFATGAVTNLGQGNTGGLIGLAANPVTISNTFATGNVSAKVTGASSSSVGGLLGSWFNTAGSTLSYSYASNAVSGPAFSSANYTLTGALIGQVGSGPSMGGSTNGLVLTSVYSDTTKSPTLATIGGVLTSTGGLDAYTGSAVTGLTTPSFKSASNLPGFTFSLSTPNTSWGYAGSTNSGLPVLCGVFTCTSIISSLSSNIFSGATDTFWSTASNWSLGFVPLLINSGDYTNIVVGSGKAVAYDTGSVGSISSAIANEGAISFAGSSSVTLSGIISGGGTLAAGGTSSVTLSGVNTFTGATTVSAGSTVKLGGSSGLGSSTSVTINGTLDLNSYSPTLALISGTSGTITNSAAGSGTSTLTTSSSTNTTFAGVIQNGSTAKVAVAKQGSGTLTLSVTNTYTGATTVTAGKLIVTGALANTTAVGVASGATYQVSANDTVGSISGAGNIVLDTGVTLTSGGDATSTTFSGEVSGSGALVKSGSGTLSLSGSNTHSGGTTISAGLLQIGAGGTSGSVSGDITNNAALAFSRSDTTSFAGVVSGTGALSQTGAGTTVLTNTNTYTGGTTVSAGALVLGASNVLADTGTVTVSGGTLNLGIYSDTVATVSLQGTGTIVGSGTLTTTGAYDLQSGIASVILAGGAAATKSGTGTVTLSGANIYSGGTTVSAGVLKLGNAASVGVGSVTVGSTATSAASLDFNGAAVTNALTVYGYGADANTGALTNSSSTAVTLVSAPTLGSNFYFGGSGSLELASNLGTSYALYKLGDGTLTLSGNNSYSGGTTVSGGTLKAGNGSALGSGTVTVGGNNTYISLDLNGQTVTNALVLGGYGFSSNGALTNSSSTAGTATGSISLPVEAYAGGANSITITGVVSGAGLNKTGSGTLTLATATTNGALRVRGGTVVLGGNNFLTTSAALAVYGSGVLDMAGYSNTVASVELNSGSIVGSGSTLTSTSDYALTNSGTISVVLAGSKGLAKSGAGTALLTGANTFSGSTSISAGTLQIGGSGNLTAGTYSSSISIASGATLEYSSSAAQTFSGVISGVGNLVKDTGAGTLVLTGTNTYAGAVTIGAGTLQIAGGGSVGSSSTVSVASGTVFEYSSSASQTLAGFSGAGTLLKDTAAGSALNLFGANSTSGGFLGDISILAGKVNAQYGFGTKGNIRGANGDFDSVHSGSIFLDTGTSLELWDSNNPGFTQIFNGAITGGGSLVGLNFANTNFGLTLTNVNNTFSGGITMRSGTLIPSYAGSLGTGTITLGTSATSYANLKINGFDVSNKLVIAGYGYGNGAGVVWNSSSTPITLTGDITLAYDSYVGGSNGNMTLSGSIGDSNANAFVKSGTNTVTLSGINSYSGATKVLAGVLSMGSGSLLGSGVYIGGISVASAATLQYASTASQTFSGAISGAGNFVKDTATSTLTLSGANTYSGATTISKGTLVVTGSLGDATAVSVASGATYQVASTDTVGSINGAGSIVVGSTYTLTSGGDNTSGTFSGVISGAGAIAKTGSGTLTLNNTTNSYSGGTNVGAGVLALGADNVLPDSGRLTVSAGTLSMGIYSDTVAAVLLTGGSIASTTGVLTSNSAYEVQSGTISAILAGSAGMNKSTPGNVALTGINTFSGDIAISGGTLQVAGSGLLGSGNFTNNVSIASGALLQDVSTAAQTITGVISGAGSLFMQSAGTLVLKGPNTFTGGTTFNQGLLQFGADGVMSGSGNLSMNGSGTYLNIGSYSNTVATLILDGMSTIIGAGTLTSSTGFDLRSGTVNSILAGSVAATKTTTGTVTLSAANTYTGGTTVSAGVLSFGASNVLADAGALTVAGGILSMGNYSDIVASVSLQSAGTISGSGTATLTSSSTYDLQSGTASAILAGIQGANKSTTGTVSLSGVNTFTGATNISAGVLQVSGSGSLNSGNYSNAISIASAAVLEYSSSAAQALTGVVSGGGEILKDGAGTLTLTNTGNSYSGGTTISAGTLALGGSGVLADAGNVTVSGTGTLSLGGYSDAVATVSLRGAGTISATGTATLTSTAAYDLQSGTASAILAGTQGANKTTVGTVTLSGANTYTGGTTVSAGTLALSASNVLADGGNLTVSATGTLSLASFSDTVATVSLQGSGTISGSGTATLTSTAAYDLQSGSASAILAGTLGASKSTVGTVTLTGANTFTGAVNIGAGRLTVGSSGSLAGGNYADTITLASNAVLQYSSSAPQTLAGVISGAGSLLKDTSAATLVLSGADTYSGGTTVSVGLLQIGAGGTSGSVSGNITNNSAVAFNRSDLSSFTGVISGSGTVNQNGSGTTALTGANTYTGATNVSLGTLQVAGTGSFGTANTYAGAISVASAAALEYSSSAAQTFTGVISGAGALFKDTATGTLVLTGANSYSGAITVGSGTVQVAGSGTLGGGSYAGAVSLASGATLEHSSSATQGLSGAITGAGMLLKDAGGTLILAAANTYTGGTTVSAGTLALGASNVLADGGNLTVSATGTLSLASFSDTVATVSLQGSGTISGSGTATLTSTAAYDLQSGSASAILAGTLGASKSTVGTVTLTGANTFTGAVNIGAGRLTVGSSGSLAGGNYADNITLASAAVLQYSSSAAQTLAGVISGAGSLLKDTSAATLVLSGADTYSGGTTVSVGTLQVTGSGYLGGGNYAGSITVASAAVLRYSSSAAQSFSGVMSGAGALLKDGSGTLTLGVANTYTGGTTVSAGMLTLGGSNVLADAGKVTVNGTGNLDLGTYSDTVSTVALQGLGSISGSGTATLTSTATFDLQSGTASAILAGTLGANKTTMGTVVLSGANTYTGTTTISAGTLQVAGSGSLGSANTYAGAISVASAAVLEYSSNAAQTFTGIISGAGALLKDTATATLVLTGTDTYTGGTTISAGTLQFGAGSITGSVSGNITNNATLAFNRSDAYSFTGTVSGSGAVNQMGTGTTTLSAANTYTGATTVTAGALQVSGSLHDITSVAVASGAKYLVASTDTVGSISGAGSLVLGSGYTFTSGGDNTSTTFSGAISGAGALAKSGNATLTLSGANSYNGSTSVGAGTLKADSSAALGTGSATVGSGASSVASLDLNGNTLTNALTLYGYGSAGAGGSVGALTNSSASSATASGTIGLGSATALGGSGAISVTGRVSGNGFVLVFVGTGDNTLSSSANTLATVATDASVGALSVVNGAALSVGAVTLGSSTYSGISSTGAVSVSTSTGDLTVSRGVSTTASSLVLGAGSASAVGTTTGGNVLLSGAPTLAVGSGGRAVLYTGSVAGSTGVTAAVGSGSGKFRYNSKLGTSNYSAALGSGLYAVYRERPTMTVSAATPTAITYGSTPSYSYTVSGQNGDTASQALGALVSVIDDGLTSGAGYLKAGTHTLTVSGAVDQLGYSLAYNTGTLTVNKAAITITGISAANKTYDASTAAVLSTSGAAGWIAGDSVSVSAVGTFDTKHVGSAKTVALSSSYAGLDAGNYQITDQASTSAAISAKAITITGISAADKTYDASTAAVLSTSGAAGWIAGDSVSVSAVGSFDTKHVGSAKTVALSSSYAGLDAGNYQITDQASTSAAISAKAITITGISAADKTYDASTAAVLSTSGAAGWIAGDSVSVSAVGSFDTKHVGSAKTVALRSSYAGLDAGNYQITDQASTSAAISQAPVLVSATPQSVTYDGVSTYATFASGSAYQVSGLVGGDAVASLTYSANRSGLAQAGSFEVLPGFVALSQGALGNYSFTYALASFTVNPAILRITANPATKVFDGTVASAAQPQVVGLVGSDRVLGLSQVYDDPGVGAGKVLRVAPGYSIADGNIGANYRVTVVDSTQGVITQGTAAQIDLSASPYPVFAPTAVPRFPGTFDLSPSVFDLPMPTKRARRAPGLDEDEQVADQPELSNQNQSPSPS